MQPSEVYDEVKPRRDGRMPPQESATREDDGGKWVRAAGSARARPWAYETLLIGSRAERERDEEIDALEEELRRAHDELTVLYRALDQHIAKVERLDKRLRELVPAADPEAAHRERPRSFPRTGLSGDGEEDELAHASAEGRSLARCEGFQVDSPAGPVGVVEGLRFVSRIDRPDLLEVRGGRLGRQLLVIPVSQVKEVVVADELVLLRSAPAANEDLLAELVERVRGALRLDHAAS
jgi:hypothetical protein